MHGKRISIPTELPVLIPFVTGLSYLLFKYRSIQQIADSLGVAAHIKDGADMTNPHHLLYAPIVKALQLFINLFTSIDAITAAQVHNIFWAVICCAAMYLLLKFATQNRLVALAGALIQILALRFWEFSTQVEVYVPAAACLMIVTCLLVIKPNANQQWKSLAVVIFFWFLAICYHQMAVLYALPLALLIADKNGLAGLKRFVVVLVVTGIVTILAYVAVYVHRTGSYSISGFAKYCVQYAYTNPDWGSMSHFTSLGELQRLGYNFGISFLPNWLIDKIPTAIQSGSLLLLMVLQFGLLKRNNLLRQAMLIWLLGCFVFLVWWTPGFEFFVLLIPAFVVLLVLTVVDLCYMLAPNKHQLLSASMLLLVAIGLGYYNFSSIKYYHNTQDSGYIEAAHVTQIGGNDACLTITNFNIMLNLLYYHNNSNTIESDGMFISFYEKENDTILYNKLANATCKTMEVWYLNPWYQPLHNNGWDKPEKWFAGLDALFEFEQNPDGTIKVNDFFLVEASSLGKPYLVIHSDRLKLSYNSYLDFFEDLDKLMLTYKLPDEAVYADWYKKNEALFEPNN